MEFNELTRPTLACARACDTWRLGGVRRQASRPPARQAVRGYRGLPRLHHLARNPDAFPAKAPELCRRRRRRRHASPPSHGFSPREFHSAFEAASKLGNRPGRSPDGAARCHGGGEEGRGSSVGAPGPRLYRGRAGEVVDAGDAARCCSGGWERAGRRRGRVAVGALEVYGHGDN